MMALLLRMRPEKLGQSDGRNRPEHHTIRGQWRVQLFQAAYFTVRLEAPVRCQANELASQPLLLTIPQVATKLGLSRTMVYNLINREGLPLIHLGSAVRAKFHLAKERRSRKRCLLGLWLAGRA